MPELPEVETIRRSLLKHIDQATIDGLDVLYPGIISGQKAGWQPSDLIGQTIVTLTRRGKYLLMHLSRGDIVIMHMRMTGKLLYRENPEDLPPHTHLHFYLAKQDGSRAHILFEDVRRFGRFFCLPKEELKNLGGGFGSLGPEPLTSAFSVDSLWAAVKRYPKRSVKALLLSQDVVAGIGNIYADESLFLSNIHPARRCRSLRRYEVAVLVPVIKKVLRAAIEAGGTTIRDYVDADDKSGTYGATVRVYGRAGKPCIECGTKLEKIREAGRGTVLCPQCQPRTGPKNVQ